MKVLLSSVLAATIGLGAVHAQEPIGTTLMNGENTTTIYDLLDETNLLEALQDPEAALTVLAPNDMAFSMWPYGIVDFLKEPENREILTSILLYHVANGTVMSSDILGGGFESITTLQGEDITVTVTMDNMVRLNDDAMVEQVDIEASNGVIHLIDSVLIPPTLAPAVANLTPTVEGIVMMDPELSTLNMTIADAGLGGVLADSEGTFTLFAPNDMAFEALLETEIVSPSSTAEDLQKILLYHVVTSGAILAMDVQNGTTVTNAADEELTFMVSDDGSVMIMGAENNATVLRTNLIGSNGVIHVIDTVLLPMMMMDNSTNSTNSTTGNSGTMDTSSSSDDASPGSGSSYVGTAMAIVSSVLAVVLMV